MKVYNLNELEYRVIAKVIKNGGIILYPTDTVAGLGSIGSSQQIVNKLYNIKKRSINLPVSYAFTKFDHINQYAFLPPLATKVKKYLPGPLTLVLPRKKNAPELFGLSSDFIGVRIPNTPWLLKLISYIGEPLITTSANISGFNTPILFDEIDPEILNQVDVVIRWTGSLLQQASTVIKFDLEGNYNVLRKGIIYDQINRDLR